MRRLGNSLFEGIKEKNPKAILKIERERHAKYLGDLTPQLKGISPVEWVKGFVRKNGTERTKAFFTNQNFGILSIVNDKNSDFFNTKLGKSNRIFYQNAYGYFKNNILKDK
jgi:hypothetical protein